MIAALFAAWMGIKNERQRQLENNERDLGRVEGALRYRSDGSPDSRDEGNLMYIIGELRSDVKNVRANVDEIKVNQSSNRKEQEALRDSLNKLGSDVAVLKRSVVSLGRRISQKPAKA